MAPLIKTDIWRVGIMRAPLSDIWRARSLDGVDITWLPESAPFQFQADPFGLWHGGMLHVFTEGYDYRSRHGVIEVFTFNRELQPSGRCVALEEPWHLSYPFLVEDQGSLYMLPEAYHSGRLSLYKAERFPCSWSKVAAFSFPENAIDATPFFHQGLWWMFYTPAHPRAACRQSVLHVAWAKHLYGPWTLHPANPVRVGRDGSRPGGTPLSLGGCVILPVQDCSQTYGGALRPLRITTLTPDDFQAELGGRLPVPGGFSPYTDGLHTLSSAGGGVTLVDAKRFDRSARRLLIDLRSKCASLRQSVLKRGPG